LGAPNTSNDGKVIAALYWLFLRRYQQTRWPTV